MAKAAANLGSVIWRLIPGAIYKVTVPESDLLNPKLVGLGFNFLLALILLTDTFLPAFAYSFYLLSSFGSMNLYISNSPLC
jgi:hypothetical protein